MDRTTAKRVVGSIFVTLPLTLMLTSLKFYGVVSVAVGELCLWLAWIVGVAGIVFSEWLWDRRLRDKIVIGATGAALFGLALIGLNYWAMAHRADAGKAPCAEDQNRPYKCRSNDELVGLLVGEQSRLRSRAEEAIYSIKISNTPPGRLPPNQERAIRDDIHHQLAEDIRKCCFRDLTDLRDEAIRRIGLPRIDPKEEDCWGHLKFSLENNPYSLGLWPETVVEYDPYLTKMEQLLRSLKEP